MSEDAKIEAINMALKWRKDSMDHNNLIGKIEDVIDNANKIYDFLTAKNPVMSR